jgi:hypothetical protein
MGLNGGSHTSERPLFLVALVAATLVLMLAVASPTVARGRPGGAWQSCPQVSGGSLWATLVRKTGCDTAQQVWNHFSSPSHPPLPAGWRCRTQSAGKDQFLTRCGRQPPAYIKFYSSN